MVLARLLQKLGLAKAKPAAVGEHDRAIRELSEATARNPSDASAFLHRGNAYLENDDPSRAISDYTEAIRLDPLNVRAYELRVRAYAEMGHYDHAISDCDEMIRLAPVDPLGFSLRAEIFVCMGDYDKAIAAYDRAIVLAQEPLHYLERASTYLKRGNYEAAIADFSEAIKLDPTFTEAYSRRSKAWAASGDRDKANADYDEALRLGTIQSGGLHRSRGLAFESKGDHERAIVEFGRAIANYDAALRIFPDDAALLYRRGIVKLDAGDDIGGNADIAAARAIKPEIADACDEQLPPCAGLRDGAAGSSSRMDICRY
jgi:tetratricopeptide (TPR) repeat protein